MPALSLNNLICAESGQTNRAILRALIHRRAMADYGCICPKSIRQAQRYYASILAQMKAAWRIKHGLPVKMTTVRAFGKQFDGVRYSAF